MPHRRTHRQIRDAAPTVQPTSSHFPVGLRVDGCAHHINLPPRLRDHCLAGFGDVHPKTLRPFESSPAPLRPASGEYAARTYLITSSLTDTPILHRPDCVQESAIRLTRKDCYHGVPTLETGTDRSLRGPALTKEISR